MLLWRGGLLLLAVTAAVEIMRSLLRFVDVPGQVEFGVAFVLAGLALVLVSLIMERVKDARSEGYLSE
jgi:hypothetical protein